jgi:hypothetical protein
MDSKQLIQLAYAKPQAEACAELLAILSKHFIATARSLFVLRGHRSAGRHNHT